MMGQVKVTKVNGKTFKVWSDFLKKATIAENENGERKILASGSYLRNDLTIRKAIACTFHEPTFRK